MEPIIGIDLGTTNSVVAIVENGVPRVIADPQTRESVLPSVVGIDPTGELLVGHPALNQAALFPAMTVRSVKRKMGRDETIQLGDRSFSPPEISAIILGRLRQWAEAELGRPVTKAVITVPAYFDDGQREATRLAGEMAGLSVMRIINEPTAAALVYDPDSDSAQKILVYDLGGGTFDVSIVAIESGVVEVLSTYGDTQLGGDDFDALISETLVEATGGLKAAIRKDAAAMARLSIAAEAAKRRLSFETFTKVNEEFLLAGEPNGNLETTLEREEYEAAILPLLERTIGCVDSALSEASMHAAQLDKVILVGGSTRTPLVEQLLAKRLNHHPAAEVDPDLCVALGAAVQGALLGGQNVSRVLVDITPHSLGIRCADSNNPYDDADKFAPIIARGSALPCKRSETFYTVSHGQTDVNVDVYQGESSHVHDNHFVGRVCLSDLDPHTPADSPIAVTFMMNLSGMLEVRAIDRASGKEAVASIDRSAEGEDRPGWLTDGVDPLKAKIAGMLGRDLQVDAAIDASDQTDADINPLSQKLAAIRASIDRIGSSASDEDSTEIDALWTRLQDAASSGDNDAFDRDAKTLDDLLFYLNDA
ncbi:MAG: Hsp70 family protein [Rubripirellula sp.]